MRLYLHSARCPTALRSFLFCNPSYWCFVPLLWNEALDENTNYFGRNFGTDLELTNMLATTAVDNHRVADYLDHVPIPPAPYSFSYLQRKSQRSFFEHFLSCSIQQLPYWEIDLYKFAVIAVCKSTNIH